MTQWESDFHRYDDPEPYAPGPIDLLCALVFLVCQATPRPVWRWAGIGLLVFAAYWLLAPVAAYIASFN